MNINQFYILRLSACFSKRLLDKLGAAYFINTYLWRQSRLYRILAIFMRKTCLHCRLLPSILFQSLWVTNWWTAKHAEFLFLHPTRKTKTFSEKKLFCQSYSLLLSEKVFPWKQTISVCNNHFWLVQITAKIVKNHLQKWHSLWLENV